MTRDDRLLDLLAAQATEGLSPEESRELERLLAEASEPDREELELAAAAVDLAFQAGEQLEPMPADLRQRILDQAPERLPSADNVAPFAGREEPPGRRFGVASLGWYAAAAMLILALWAPWRPGPVAPIPPPATDEQRASLIEGATDLIRVDWAPPEIEAYAAVTGDVVWSNERQQGFMRLRGLPANRDEVEQYQLWIVDPSRDDKPIDGGVFDIPAGADEVIVPIDAKLRVADPKAFAITLEQPGGVVVSDGPLLVVAPVEA